jgi:hypothetical protein
LINATLHNDTYGHIPLSTTGIVFLGTPHRGTAAAKWGELIAKSGAMLGFSTEDRILKDLQRDSESLVDLLYHFSNCLFRYSISVVCLFEQLKTDYGRRLAGFVSWNELVRTALLGNTSTLLFDLGC